MLATTGAAAPSIASSPFIVETSTFTPRGKCTVKRTATSFLRTPLIWYSPAAPQWLSCAAQTAQIVTPRALVTGTTDTLLGCELRQLFSVVTSSVLPSP